MISENFVKSLKLNLDDKVDFCVTSTTNVSKKAQKLFHKLYVVVGDFETNLSAIILEGLHFDVLLEVNWIKSLKVIINVEKNILTIGKKTITYGF